MDSICIDELSIMLLKEFTTDDEQVFVQNYQTYLKYNDNTKFIVDLDDVWKSIGFSSKQKAKLHICKQFNDNVDFVINSLTRRVERVYGGQNNINILLNVDTFKSMCMTANTDQGKRTRLYYIKMEKIFFKYLEMKNKDVIAEMELKNKTTIELNNQKTLISAYKGVPCVYICKIDSNTEKVKIGETDDISQRIKTLQMYEYPDCVLLDVFQCDIPHNFEQYLLHRPDIKSIRESRTEVLRLSDEFTYSQLISIIKKNINSFNKIDRSRNTVMVKLMGLIENEANTSTKEQLTQMLLRLDTTIPTLDTEDITPVPASQRKIYKYHFNNLKEPVETFNSFRDAARSLKTDKFKNFHVKEACVKNTQIDEYRFFCVEGDGVLPNTIPYTVTVQPLNSPEIGLIAQIHKDRPQIINVYATKQLAAEANNVKACSVTVASKTKRLCAGYRWCMYEHCDDELKNTFNGVLPEHVIKTSSKSVQQIDPLNNNVVDTFVCMQDVCKKYKICHKKLNSLTKSGDIYKGYKWVCI